MTATAVKEQTEASDSLNALSELLEILPEKRTEMVAAQQQPDGVVDLLRQAGIYRALVAKRFGGDEMSPADFLRIIERISTVDASTGWVASFGFSAIYLSALPLPTLEKMYANGPDVIFAGGIFPPQPAVPVDGGLKVKGRWAWGSGCTGADLIGVGIKVEGSEAAGGLPRIAVMPASKVEIDRGNWDVNGMRGTGSHDMVVNDVVVPEEWTFVRGGSSSLDEPLYRYPSMALAAQVLAVVALGAARGALDGFIEMAGGRNSITGAPVLADRAFVQTEIAKAEAAVRSAKAFFYETTEHAFQALVSGDELDKEQRVMLRLSASNAARAGADACLSVYKVAGTEGIFAGGNIGQKLQDSLVVPQHAFLSEGTYMSAGRCILGLEPFPGFL
ncbi:MAG: acyl-CoA dehydrogenase family protein [Erythrobacter sp.]